MKTTPLFSAGLLAVALTVSAQDRPSGYFDFGKLPTASGGEHVEVSVGGTIASIASRFIDKSEPEAAKVLRSIKSLRVHVIELKDDNRAQMVDRIKAIRTDLEGKAWEKIVSAKSKKEDVAIFLKSRGEEAIEGLVLTVLDGNKEAVLINIVGDIKPEQLAVLADKLHIDPLKKFAKAKKS